MFVERAPNVDSEQQMKHEIPPESPSFNEMPMVEKQTLKKQPMFTPYKIMIGIFLLFILTLVAYKMYLLAFAGSAASQINQGQNKFIQNSGESTDKSSGSSASSSKSSKASRDSSKPMSTSTTAGKSVIGEEDAGGDDPEDEDDESGAKRNSHLRKNKMGSDNPSTRDGPSDEESEDEEDASADFYDSESQRLAYSPAGNFPLTGKTRN